MEDTRKRPRPCDPEAESAELWALARAWRAARVKSPDPEQEVYWWGQLTGKKPSGPLHQLNTAVESGARTVVFSGTPALCLEFSSVRVAELLLGRMMANHKTACSIHDALRSKAKRLKTKEDNTATHHAESPEAAVMQIATFFQETCHESALFERTESAKNNLCPELELIGSMIATQAALDKAINSSTTTVTLQSAFRKGCRRKILTVAFPDEAMLLVASKLAGALQNEFRRASQSSAKQVVRDKEIEASATMVESAAQAETRLVEWKATTSATPNIVQGEPAYHYAGQCGQLEDAIKAGNRRVVFKGRGAQCLAMDFGDVSTMQQTLTRLHARNRRYASVAEQAVSQIRKEHAKKALAGPADLVPCKGACAGWLLPDDVDVEGCCHRCLDLTPPGASPPVRPDVLKKCNKCPAWKPPSEFYDNSKRECRQCVSEIAKEKRACARAIAATSVQSEIITDPTQAHELLRRLYGEAGMKAMEVDGCPRYNFSTVIGKLEELYAPVLSTQVKLGKTGYQLTFEDQFVVDDTIAALKAETTANRKAIRDGQSEEAKQRQKDKRAERYANESTEYRRARQRLGDMNKQERQLERMADDLRKCDGVGGCFKVKALDEFRYSPAQAGCTDFHLRQPGWVDKVSRHSVCRDCFSRYLERGRQYERLRGDRSDYRREYESRPDVKMRRAQYAADHPEAAKRWQQTYREKNRDQLLVKGRERMREYRQTQQYRDYKALWATQINLRRLEIHGKFNAGQKPNTRGALVMTDEEIETMLCAPECFYCGLANGTVDEDGKGELMLGLDRVVPDGDYAVDNVVPCCWQCNSAKGIHDQGEFYRALKQVVDFTDHGIAATVPVNHYLHHQHKQDGKFAVGTKFAYFQGNAKNRGLVNELNLVRYEAMRHGRCVFCGIAGTHGRPLGVDRMDSSVGYTVGNSNPCCSACNMLKMTSTRDEFLGMARAVTERWNASQ